MLFGRIIKGYEIIDAIHDIPRKEEKPSQRIVITKCGQLLNESKIDCSSSVDSFIANYDRNVFEEDEKRRALKQQKKLEKLNLKNQNE